MIAHERLNRAPKAASAKRSGGALALWQRAKNDVLERAQRMKPGDPLPTYEQLAAELGCSLAPVKRAMDELARQGWVSLHRGRAARVLWAGSFSRSTRAQGHESTTRLFLAENRVLTPAEQDVASSFGLDASTPCIVCGRVRSNGGAATALQRTYINPRAFANPARFFVDHDLSTASLRDIYGELGVRPLQVHALLNVELADRDEADRLGLAAGAPVLRAQQTTVVELRGHKLTLEVMHATYTRAVQYEVDRIPTFLD